MKTTRVLLPALFCIACVAGVRAQTADEVIDKSLAAIGGKEKLLALNTLVTEGVLNIAGQEINIKITQVHNKAQRIDIVFGGMGGYTIQTRDSGWSYLPFQGQKIPAATPADVIKESGDLLDLQSPLLNYREKGHTVELLGKEGAGGEKCYKLKLVAKSGVVLDLFIDTVNYYIVKQVIKTKAGGQPKEQVQSFSNFKKLENGYTFPFSLTGFGPGELKVTKIDVNPSVDPSVFIPSY